LKTIILANGEIPTHPKALEALLKATQIVCCDGAINNLVELGFNPTVIIGDLDSISEAMYSKYRDIIIADKDVEYNDLQKAIRYCISMNWNDIIILGGFGKREDHALANISIMLQYSNPLINLNFEFKIKMITNTGLFTPIFQTTTFESFEKQQVSIFSFDKNSKLTFHGLKYPVENRSFQYLWEGSLNESLSNSFTIECSGGEVVVFQVY
jgi:thiamine pyrophosphokinase